MVITASPIPAFRQWYAENQQSGQRKLALDGLQSLHLQLLFLLLKEEL